MRLCFEDMEPLAFVGIGDRDRVRARFSRLESESEPPFSSAIDSGDLCRCDLAAERVTGAK